MNKIVYILKKLIPSFIITVLFCILLMVLLLLGYKKADCIVAIGVLEVCFGLMWWVLRAGLFSGAQYGLKRFLNSTVNRRKAKIGVFEEKERKETLKIKEYKSGADVEEQAAEKSMWSIFATIGFGTIIILVSLAYMF